MSGVQAPHLQRREGIYYLRVRVPDAVRPLVGKTEIVRSLRIGLLREARPRAALLTALVMEAFDVIKTTEMTNIEARSLVQQYCASVIAEQERRGGYIPQTNEPDMEILEQRGFSEDRIADLNEQASLSRFDGDVRQRVLRTVNSLKMSATAWRCIFMSRASRVSLSEGPLIPHSMVSCLGRLRNASLSLRLRWAAMHMERWRR